MELYTDSLSARVQTAVQELLKTFENSTQNNSPTAADTNIAANNSATAAADADDDDDDDGGNVDGDVVSDGRQAAGPLLPLTAVNQTHQNNSYNCDGSCPGQQAVQPVSRISNVQRQNANAASSRPAANPAPAPVRRTTSQTVAGRRAGRSLSWVQARHTSSSALSLHGRGALPRHGRDSTPQQRRSASPSPSSHQRLQHQRDSDRPSRQTSRQLALLRRRSTIGLPLNV